MTVSILYNCRIFEVSSCRRKIVEFRQPGALLDMAQKIIRKLNDCWRLFGTGFSVFSFGLGGLLLWLLVFPVLSVLPGSRLQRISRGQRVVHTSFYAFIALMHRIGIMTYEINGLEKLNRPGQLIIAIIRPWSTSCFNQPDSAGELHRQGKLVAKPVHARAYSQCRLYQ